MVLRWQVRDARRGVRLAFPHRRRIGYIGWVGHGNMGDEACFEAYRRALPSWAFAAAPSARLLRPVDALTPHRLVVAAALGGGTLIGWPHFRRMFEALTANGVRGFMLGTGVEDPDFYGENPFLVAALERTNGRSGSDRLVRELARWEELFARMPAVAVRGPRSQEVLAEAGITSQIVGDPALLLADAAPTGDVQSKLLGLNVGLCEGLWGGDVRSVLDAVVEVGRAMRSQGWRIRLVPLSPSDPPLLREAARLLGGAVELITEYRDLERLRTALRECHVFVGQKLHAVVLASSVYVPTLALEYHPKCRDFQRSLSRDSYVVRTDRLDTGGMLERVEELGDARDAHAAALVSAVARLRGPAEELRDRVVASLARTGANAVE